MSWLLLAILVALNYFRAAVIDPVAAGPKCKNVPYSYYKDVSPRAILIPSDSYHPYELSVACSTYNLIYALFCAVLLSTYAFVLYYASNVYISRIIMASIETDDIKINRNIRTNYRDSLKLMIRRERMLAYGTEIEHKEATTSRTENKLSSFNNQQSSKPKLTVKNLKNNDGQEFKNDDSDSTDCVVLIGGTRRYRNDKKQQDDLGNNLCDLELEIDDDAQSYGSQDSPQLDGTNENNVYRNPLQFKSKSAPKLLQLSIPNERRDRASTMFYSDKLSPTKSELYIIPEIEYDENRLSPYVFDDDKISSPGIVTDSNLMKNVSKYDGVYDPIPQPTILKALEPSLDESSQKEQKEQKANDNLDIKHSLSESWTSADSEVIGELPVWSADDVASKRKETETKIQLIGHKSTTHPASTFFISNFSSKRNLRSASVISSTPHSPSQNSTRDFAIVPDISIGMNNNNPPRDEASLTNARIKLLKMAAEKEGRAVKTISSRFERFRRGSTSGLSVSSETNSPKTKRESILLLENQAALILKMMSNTEPDDLSAEENLNSIFLFNSPKLYFRAIEAMFLFQSFFIALAMTQMIPILSYGNYNGGWTFAFILLIGINFYIMQRILTQAVLLRSVYQLDHEIAGKVIENSNELRNSIESLRHAVFEKLKEEKIPEDEWKEFLNAFFFNRGTKVSKVIKYREFRAILNALQILKSKQSFDILWQAVDYDLSGGLSSSEVQVLFLYIFYKCS